jgi:hypothetical protein
LWDGNGPRGSNLQALAGKLLYNSGAKLGQGMSIGNSTDIDDGSNCKDLPSGLD